MTVDLLAGFKPFYKNVLEKFMSETCKKTMPWQVGSLSKADYELASDKTGGQGPLSKSPYFCEFYIFIIMGTPWGEYNSDLLVENIWMGWSESSSSWLEQGDERDVKITGLVETLLVLAEIHGRVLISNSREVVDPWSQHHRIQILTTINTRKETALSVPWCKPSKWNRFIQTVRQILVVCNSSSRKLKYAKSSPCSWSNAKHYLEVKHWVTRVCIKAWTTVEGRLKLDVCTGVEWVSLSAI